MSVGSESQRIEALLEMRRGDEAAELIHRELRENPDSVPLLLQLARAEVWRDNYSVVVDLGRAVLRIEPDSAEAMRLLSAGLRHMGHADEALAAASAAIERAPFNAFNHRQRAAVLFQFASVLRGPDGRVNVTRNLYFSRSDIDQAVALLPSRATFHVLRGQILKRLDDVSEARAAWNHALSIDPTNSDALSLLAELDIEQERLGSARAHASAGLGVDPQSAHLRHQIGKIAARRLISPLWFASVPTTLAIALRPSYERPIGAIDVLAVLGATALAIVYLWWWWRRISPLERRTLVEGSARLVARVAAVAWHAFILIGLTHALFTPPPRIAPRQQPGFAETMWNLPIAFFSLAPLWVLVQYAYAAGARFLDRRAGQRRLAKVTNEYRRG